MTRRFSLILAALLPGGLLSMAAAPAFAQQPATRPARAATTRPTTRPATRPAARPTADTIEHYPAPPAPPLSPDEEMKTFDLPVGFHAELVAAEPMIEDPVVAVFDEDGRLWVAEMRSYMLDPYAHNEQDPIGRVVVLESSKHDGKFDKRTVYLDNIYLPRAICPVAGGVLIGSPPHLWFCRDTKGDLHCDQKTEISDRYGIAKDPEYGDNGLLWDRDNWIYNANSTVRFRFTGRLGAPITLNSFESSPTAQRGQWGLTQDDVGRLYFNYNSDQLRGDMIPTEYLSRNSHYKAQGGNYRIETDQHVWSSRPNPGINRGYEPGNLRADGALNTVTATCGPTIFRGTALGEDHYGDAFIPEPTGNLVMRKRLTETDGAIKSKSVLHDRDGRQVDFLTSTDERFRPVNTYTGPDGALYVVDLYRGLIQHQVYLTPFLRNQVFERKLEAPLHWGRIFRIVKNGAALAKLPHMSGETTAQVVEHLSDPNGWIRDTAQRVLVQRGDNAAVPLLQTLAISGAKPLGRLQALWALKGMDAIDVATLRKAVDDKDARVAAAAIRLSEPLMVTRRGTGMLDDVLRQANRPQVRLQFVLSISDVSNEKAQQALANVLASAADKPFIRDAAMSGLSQRELPFLEKLLSDPQWQAEGPGRAGLIGALATCVYGSNDGAAMAKLLTLAQSQTGDAKWRQDAMLDSLAAIARAPGRKLRVALKEKPDEFLKLEESDDKRIADRTKVVMNLLTWPGKPLPAQAEQTPLTDAQLASFERGKIVFTATCAQCHQADGNGMEGKAPSLLDSPIALGPDIRLIRLVLNGAKGEFHVTGWVPNQEMPTLAILPDAQIADVLTYIRHEWGHNAPPVTTRTVQQIRTLVGDRQTAWTEQELLAVPAPAQPRGGRGGPTSRRAAQR
ncbi:MAG TPA: PVC-type heme-binding CxxCH protein [Humisphaera sp.]|jgi:putative membrane-bound dehydrogenase-like protein|nr:PVC-type heme-binding CxxCH protein [Humisphaera sp.]